MEDWDHVNLIRPLAFAAMMWTSPTAIVELATGSIRDRRAAEVIMNARRKWALENAACALVVFGTIAAVLLVNAESTTGSTDYTRSAPGSYSDEDRTIMDALIFG